MLTLYLIYILYTIMFFQKIVQNIAQISFFYSFASQTAEKPSFHFRKIFEQLMTLVHSVLLLIETFYKICY